MTVPRKLSKKPWEKQMLIIIQIIRSMCGSNMQNAGKIKFVRRITGQMVYCKDGQCRQTKVGDCNWLFALNIFL
jgi:hypothetical protein